MRKDISRFMIILSAIIALNACSTEGVKLEPDDRALIDTLVKREMSIMTVKMDNWCKDSTPILRQKMVDSLLIVREQEIMQKTSELPSGISYPQ
jgi:hypothetical protein